MQVHQAHRLAHHLAEPGVGLVGGRDGHDRVGEHLHVDRRHRVRHVHREVGGVRAGQVQRAVVAQCGCHQQHPRVLARGHAHAVLVDDHPATVTGKAPCVHDSVVHRVATTRLHRETIQGLQRHGHSSEPNRRATHFGGRWRHVRDRGTGTGVARRRARGAGRHGGRDARLQLAEPGRVGGVDDAGVGRAARRGRCRRARSRAPVSSTWRSPTPTRARPVWPAAARRPCWCAPRPTTRTSCGPGSSPASRSAS